MRLPDASDQIRLAPLRALRAVFSGVGQLLVAADRLREEDARLEGESGDDQHEALRSWDGRLSSSVRLISSSGMPAPRSGDPARAPGRKPERTGRKPERIGGKTERTGGKPAQTGGKPARTGGKPESAGRRAGQKTTDGAAERGAGGARKPGRSKSAAEPSRFRSLDLTGNVRMLSDQDIADLATDQLKLNTADAGAHESAEQAPQAVSGAPGVQAAETVTPSWSQAAPSWSSWSTGAPQPPPFPSAEPPPAGHPAADLPISGYDELSLPSLRARLRNLDAAELRDLLAHERSHANRDDVVTMFERRIAKLAEAAD